MSQVPLWFERKFDFSFPVEYYPNVCVRLRGTPARLEDMVSSVPPRLMLAKPAENAWSAQEHAGHLLDLEELWAARVNDFLSDRETLTVADLSNRKTREARHNNRKLSQILAGFRAARQRLIAQVNLLNPDLFGRSKLHPRLNQPMRLVDHLYFVAEHDDHHLARILELIGS